MNYWIAPNPNLLPDFIIGGAMKCGTTSLHQILNSHPKVFIPNEEVNFFDIDNILQHSDFNFYKNGNWEYHSMDKNTRKLWDWYESKFEGNENLLKGEDSTTYLASSIAAERIALQSKPIKLIFILRQPSERAYSNYLHLLKTGRAIYNFEDMLINSPSDVLTGSLYYVQLKAYYEHIPKPRIKVVYFEDLVENPKLVIKDLANFLDLDFSLFPNEAFSIHANKTILPRYLKLQLINNKIFRRYNNSRYIDLLTNSAKNQTASQNILKNLINKVYNKMWLTKNHKMKSMNKNTKLFLDDFFKVQLKGIDELVEKDILSKWFRS